MQIAVALLLTSLTNNVRALQHPEAPAQHCRHDAGPPWADDEENFGNKAYFDGTPAAPKGDCPAPRAAAFVLVAVLGRPRTTTSGRSDAVVSRWVASFDASPRGVFTTTTLKTTTTTRAIIAAWHGRLGCID